MAKSKAKAEPEYRLEHRLTGAAILVAFAVLIIPFLLKEPGVEASTENASAQSDSSQKTFKSKIEPLNLSNVTGDTVISALQKEDNIETPSSDKDAPKVTGLQNESADAEGKNQTKTALVMTPDKKPEEKTQQKDEKKTLTDEEKQVTKKQKVKTENLKVAATENRKDAKSEGWSVRVGTFSKAANVESVNKLLSNSGFKPRQTKVETSLGEATRVWLGPYEEKAKAEKVSARLKTLTGEKGYVTKHTS